MVDNKLQWGSRVGLILAMAGNAVGLGNFLRFPVQAVQNGGGAFIIPYLVCFLLMGVPLLFIEWSIGRFGGQFGHHTTPFAFARMSKARMWKYIGVFGIFSNITIASYYCYIESWTMSYVYHSAVGTFAGMDQNSVAAFFDDYLNVFTSTTGIPFEAIVFFVVCLVLNTWVLSRGLSGGVEKAAKIGMPLLIVFGIFLAVKAIFLKAGQDGAVYDGTVGLNFLWTPQFDSLANPKVWLAAAGQIFFTLSLGQGSVQCYAAYVKKKDDIALNAMSAGWMNEFVEVVLGSAIIIPISIGYLGIDRVVELTSFGGLGLGFRTMPFLFQQWGPLLAAVAGVAFFGLLFFAGITSTLAMGTPVMSFLIDEFNWRRSRAAMGFGFSVLLLGLPTVVFFKKGVFDEYDYWAGTVSLVVFAMFEAILFAWVFGMKKGWQEITDGADIKVPAIFKYILKFVTPVILILVFVTSLIRPANDDWSKVSITGWEVHPESIIAKIRNDHIGPNCEYFTDTYYAETAGVVDSVYTSEEKNVVAVVKEDQSVKMYETAMTNSVVVKKGDRVDAGVALFSGSFINNVFYVDMSRLLLVALFLSICVLIFVAYRKRKKEGTI
ncbi:MAG TPA: sodium-dependent transporter [Bacteroidales bacterium]|nr:sodium-dependent transporter [Bacteroidales bacterium]HPB26267.1 sodium-dependent transporter [Bacteroidales bacterium]HPI31641.1 sodium-dependent transporter [Bacteroidales bacterium]HQP16632.1 sodium-dependent transporter [Bacteroidales bacterium]